MGCGGQNSLYRVASEADNQPEIETTQRQVSLESMSLRFLKPAVKGLLPPGLYRTLNRFVRGHMDMNVTVSPNQLWHIARYQFAQKVKHGGSVLDAACGSGYGSELLEPFKQYTGIDYSGKCIDYAKMTYGKPNRRFVKGNIAFMTEMFSAQSFDTIVSFETLEHLEDPERILGMFLRLLKPTGMAVMSIPLNHPDLIYHKCVYTHQTVRTLFEQVRSHLSSAFQLEEYRQSGLRITPLADLLPPRSGGTWIGLLTFTQPFSQRNST